MIDTTELTVPVGEAVLGRVFNGHGEPIDGGAPLEDVLRVPVNQERAAMASHDTTPQMLPTGIKVVDLFAPLVRGGIAETVATNGVGKLVLLAELVEATARRGGHALCLGLEERAHTTNGLMLEMRSMGVDGKLAMVFAQRGDDQAEQERVLAAGFTMAQYFRERGEDVLLLADRQLVQHQFDALRDRVGTTAKGAITAVLFDLVHDDDASAGVLDSVDSCLVFSTALAKQTLYPAIDPPRSHSRLLDATYVGDQHVVVAQQARDLLERYADLHEVVTADGLETLATEDRTVAMRARRIQRFLTQPFVVAELWIGQPGEQVALADTIAGVSAILAGRYDDMPEDALRFIGVLPYTTT